MMSLNLPDNDDFVEFDSTASMKKHERRDSRSSFTSDANDIGTVEDEDKMHDRGKQQPK